MNQFFLKATWILTWPIHLVFLFTIPDCEKPRFKKWFPLTFIMCIVWIGSLSYVVAWMITIIGDTLKIPDSVMGITFLAAGTSVPEAVSSVIVAKQGKEHSPADEFIIFGIFQLVVSSFSKFPEPCFMRYQCSIESQWMLREIFSWHLLYYNHLFCFLTLLFTYFVYLLLIYIYICNYQNVLLKFQHLRNVPA